MKITYRREMKHNYMMIDPESLVWRNYECRMLAANSIDGVLHFQLRQVDDEIRFYYEITSKQPLSRMLEGRELQEAQLRSVILGIAKVLDRMEQYLLREGSILLEPEQIYVEPDSYRVWLCVVPGMERDLTEDYGRLLEYLLGKINHQDKNCVVLAYGLYQESRKENYGMADILRVLKPDQERHKETGADASNKEAADYRADGSTKLEKQSREQNAGRQGAEGGRRPGAKETKPHGNGRKPDTFLGGIRAWWERRIRKAPDPVCAPWEMLYKDEIDPLSEIQSTPEIMMTPSPVQTPPVQVSPVQTPPVQVSPVQTPPVQVPPVQILPVQTPPVQIPSVQASPIPSPSAQVPPVSMQPGQDTVLLADFTPSSETNRYRLRSPDGEHEDILLSYFPFIIGKQQNLVDYYLAGETVSRLHVRFDRTDGEIVVQDLNSTNGTMVAGHLLDNNESVKVREGEEICIARYRYRFERF